MGSLAKKLLQSGTEVVAKWDGSCYKVGEVLQSETDVVTKWDWCYKVGSNNVH